MKSFLQLLCEISSNESLKDFLAQNNPMVGVEKVKALSTSVSLYTNKFGSYRFVKLKEGVPIAVIQVVSKNKGIGHVTNAFTLPEYRRQGITKELMKFVRQIFSTLTFSDDLSEDGKKFVKYHTK